MPMMILMTFDSNDDYDVYDCECTMMKNYYSDDLSQKHCFSLLCVFVMMIVMMITVMVMLIVMMMRFMIDYVDGYDDDDNDDLA